LSGLTRLFPSKPLVGESSSAEADPFRHQPFLLHPCIFARRPNCAAGAHHTMPRQACRATAHRGRNLARTDADDATDLAIRENPAWRYASDESINLVALIARFFVRHIAR